MNESGGIRGKGVAGKMKVPKRIERYRITKGKLASDVSYGPNGSFRVPGPNKATLNIIVSNGGGWEHASVSIYRKERTPTWAEMCFAKDLFWGGRNGGDSISSPQVGVYKLSSMDVALMAAKISGDLKAAGSSGLDRENCGNEGNFVFREG